MAPDINKPHVLLVEDNQVAQKIHTYFLKKLGFAIDLASNGREALNYVRKKNYFAMILDLGLPDMNGEMVISKIREQESKLAQTLPIIIVTAHGDPTILERFKKTDKANDVFTKPVNFLELKHALKKISCNTTNQKTYHSK